MINNTQKQEAIRLLVDIKTQIITGTENQYEIQNMYTKNIGDKKLYICKTSVGDVEIDFHKVNELFS